MAHHNLGYLYYEQGDFERAGPLFQPTQYPDKPLPVGQYIKVVQ